MFSHSSYHIATRRLPDDGDDYDGATYPIEPTSHPHVRGDASRDYVRPWKVALRPDLALNSDPPPNLRSVIKITKSFGLCRTTMSF